MNKTAMVAVMGERVVISVACGAVETMPPMELCEVVTALDRALAVACEVQPKRINVAARPIDGSDAPDGCLWRVARWYGPRSIATVVCLVTAASRAREELEARGYEVALEVDGIGDWSDAVRVFNA